MSAKDFMRNNLPYCIEKEDGEWVVKNRDYKRLSICHLPDREIAKAALNNRVDEDGNITAIWLYDDGTVPNSRTEPGKLNSSKWEDYCDRLKILVTKKPKTRRR